MRMKRGGFEIYIETFEGSYANVPFNGIISG